MFLAFQTKLLKKLSCPHSARDYPGLRSGVIRNPRADADRVGRRAHFRIQSRTGSEHALTRTSPQPESTSSFSIALICTARRRNQASANTNPGPEKSDLMQNRTAGSVNALTSLSTSSRASTYGATNDSEMRSWAKVQGYLAHKKHPPSTTTGVPRS